MQYSTCFHTVKGRQWPATSLCHNRLPQSAAEWLIEQNPVLVGADNWGIEGDPPPNGKRPIEVHQRMITRNGINFLENLDLEGLAKDGVSEFAFVYAPLRVKGATENPIAGR